MNERDNVEILVMFEKKNLVKKNNLYSRRADNKITEAHLEPIKNIFF